jgi:hypothetical protein
LRGHEVNWEQEAKGTGNFKHGDCRRRMVGHGIKAEARAGGEDWCAMPADEELAESGIEEKAGQQNLRNPQQDTHNSTRIPDLLPQGFDLLPQRPFERKACVTAKATRRTEDSGDCRDEARIKIK